MNETVSDGSSGGDTNKDSIDHEIKTFREHLNNLRDQAASDVNSIINSSKELHESIKKIKSEAEENQILTEEAEDSLNESKALIEKARTLLKEIEELHTKTDGLYKGSVSRRQNIDAIYFYIEGQEVEEDDGEKKKVPGLKDKLSSTYNDLENNSKKLQEKIEGDILKTDRKLEELATKANSSMSDFKASWEENLSKLRTDIRKLLPDALTAGLSHAYEARRSQEEVNAKNHRGSFQLAIFFMALFALIPVGVGYYQFHTHTKTFDELIGTLPNLVSIIIPLYIPIFWIAYSSNKQVNLSKRLIEEYAHKESVAKTFEGLSRQVESLDDGEMAKDLRNKLLYNLLEISSENPGKLITDYNKSDHPLMDALDKSVQLTNAVEKLARIPGFNKIAKKMVSKSEDVMKSQSQKAEAGLEAVAKDSD